MVYLGEDTTDEAAFRATRDGDVTVRVGQGPAPTAARYVVADPAEVADFPGWLADVGGPLLDD